MERGRPPLLGTLKLSGDLARKCSALLCWIEEAHQVHHFDGVAWERPIITPRDKVDKLEILYGMVGVAAAFAGNFKLPWQEVTIQEAKFALTGKSNAQKVEMIAGAMELGWKPATEHEADAGAVALVGYARFWPKKEAA